MLLDDARKIPGKGHLRTQNKPRKAALGHPNRAGAEPDSSGSPTSADESCEANAIVKPTTPAVGSGQP
jgi:hypothetical protein